MLVLYLAAPWDLCSREVHSAVIEHLESKLGKVNRGQVWVALTGPKKQSNSAEYGRHGYVLYNLCTQIFQNSYFKLRNEYLAISVILTMN